jgi:hypothetical protein
MKISPHWLRDFVDLPVDYRRLADELTLAGVAVEGISGEGENTVFRDGDHDQPSRRDESLWRGARGLGALRSAAPAD